MCIRDSFVEAPAIRYIPESRIPNSSFELTTEGESEGELDALVWDEWANENKLENFYVEKGDAHSGDYYAVQKGDADYCGGLYYSLSDLQDGVYDVSVWVKASEHTKDCLLYTSYTRRYACIKTEPSLDRNRIFSMSCAFT